MLLTPIHLLTSGNLGGDKFEETLIQRGTSFYAINGRAVDRFEFEERVLAAYERAQVRGKAEEEERADLAGAWRTYK